MKPRPLHYVPDPAYPFRTACAAGRSTLTVHGTTRWRSVETTADAAAVTCPRCRAYLVRRGDIPGPPWTAHCWTCEWTAGELPSHRAAQRWAKWHRDATRDPTLGAHVCTPRRIEPLPVHHKS